ncbi:MFS general transporter [Teratosphaeria destructans]|uniref:Cercosporin MFS transporter CTB4 n=1 Tax=Teratosphaeria destructans TaxID=418781 RepID=A0A9W7T0N6_9PEZI|nr:MFS general transporter [Teratosphaeria destructans]
MQQTDGVDSTILTPYPKIRHRESGEFLTGPQSSPNLSPYQVTDHRESGVSLTVPQSSLNLSPYQVVDHRESGVSLTVPQSTTNLSPYQVTDHRESGEPLTGPPVDPDLVLLGPNDPLNPQNIPAGRKWFLAGLLGALTFAVTFSSSVFSTVIVQTAEEFHVSEEVTTLGTALFVFGFAMGPIIAGPSSELYGRKKPLLLSYAVFIIFQIPVAVAQNVETMLIFRFLGAVAASGPPAIVGGYLADFFAPVDRGLAVAIFGLTTQMGPLLGPIIGSFVTQSYLRWRWTAWLTMIISSFFGIISLFCLPETFVPRLMTLKARRLRFTTRNWALHSQQEMTPVDFRSFAVRYLTRPFSMLVHEPILLVCTIYVSFVFGFLYLLFSAFPFSYVDERGYSNGVGSLPFIAVFVGVLLAAGYITHFSLTTVKHSFKKHGQIIPEERLIPCIYGAILLVVGCFWFAWTSFPSISPWPQILSGIPIGAGIYLVYLQYLVDVYVTNANSALSANTIVRSFIGGGFPLLAGPMYKTLGTRWATSLLGFIALVFVPAPILLYKYGAKIRRMSKICAEGVRCLSTTPPNILDDSLEWFRKAANGRKYEDLILQLDLYMVAIHPTSDLLGQAVLNLATYSEWKIALAEFYLIDSFLKETQRMKPIGMTSMRRLAIKDVELLNGIELRKGDISAIASAHRMWSQDIYEDPVVFDSYRFIKRRRMPGQKNRSWLMSTITDFMASGYGKHACARRFFAANDLKIVLAHSVLKYDIKLVDGEKVPTLVEYGFATIPRIPKQKLW